MAEKVFEVLKSLPLNNLKKAYLIYSLNQIIKNNISPNLANKINVTDFEKKLLIIETQNLAWVQEINFQKNILLDLFAKNGVVLDNIRVTFATSEEKKQRVSQNCCLKCQQPITTNRKICVKCQNQQERFINKKIEEILTVTPWVKYSQLKEELLQQKITVDEEQFIKIREKMRAQSYDFIKKHSYTLYESQDAKLKQKLQRKAEFYVMIKNLLTINQINDKIIEKTLGGMLYTVIYKTPKIK